MRNPIYQFITHDPWRNGDFAFDRHLPSHGAEENFKLIQVAKLKNGERSRYIYTFVKQVDKHFLNFVLAFESIPSEYSLNDWTSLGLELNGLLFDDNKNLWLGYFCAELQPTEVAAFYRKLEGRNSREASFLYAWWNLKKSYDFRLDIEFHNDSTILHIYDFGDYILINHGGVKVELNPYWGGYLAIGILKELIFSELNLYISINMNSFFPDYPDYLITNNDDYVESFYETEYGDYIDMGFDSPEEMYAEFGESWDSDDDDYEYDDDDDYDYEYDDDDDDDDEYEIDDDDDPIRK